ncbi:MAG: PAS domain S-box protein [Acidobacteria bacterium]|nr:PAS domain S-box protein [Acidobacteriota bacterium]
MDPHEKTARRSGYGFLLVFIVLAVGIVASGFFFYGNYKKHFRAEIERQLSAVAELKVSELAEWRAESLADATIFFKNASFSGLVRQFLEKPKDSAARDQLRIWLSRFQAAHEYDRIFLLDVHGVERLSAPDIPEPVAAHLLEQAPEILRSGRVTFVDFRRDAPDGPVHLSILVPVLDDREDMRAAGILVLMIDPEKYLYPYINRWPTPSRTAETLIVRRDGNDALFLNELRFQKNTALNLRSPLGNTDMPAVKAALGQEGFVEGVDYRGVPVLAALRAVPDSPWFLVARMDVAEAFAPLRERVWVMIVLVGSLLLGAGGGTGFVWRHQRARFYREGYHAAEELRESEGRMRDIMFSMADWVWEVDENGIYTFSSQQGTDIFGRSAEDIIGKTPFDLMPPDEAKRAAAIFSEIAANKAPIKDLENWNIGKNGERFCLLTNGVPILDAAGNLKGYRGVDRDITESKRAEEALNKSEAKYRNLVENASIGIFRTKIDGLRVLDANPKLCEILGLTREEFVGQPSAIAWAHAEQREELVRLLREKGNVSNYEIDLRTKSGEIRTVLISMTTYPELGYLEGGLQDITERKRAEEALRESEKKYRMLVETANESIVVVQYGLLKFVNPASIGLMRGYSEQELMDRPFSEFIHPDDRAMVVENYRRRIANEAAQLRYTFRVVTRDGIVKWVEINAALIEWQGKPATLNFLTDITERKRAEEAIRRNAEELQEKNDELIRFTYTVSHDLKSPLVTIRTFLGYLEQDIRKPDAAIVDKDLTYIRNAADKVSRLLDELLELSRIGRKVNPPVEVPLQEVVKEALDLVAGRIAERGVTVKVTKEPVQLTGDRPRLVEVFQNLVDNAVKFMGRERTPCVEIGVDKVGGETVLFVRDNGIGIDPQYQPKLFGMFEKLDPGTEGTGIGLALVKRIVEVHGGRIWVESEGPGKGATFRFTVSGKEKK